LLLLDVDGVICPVGLDQKQRRPKVFIQAGSEVIGFPEWMPRMLRDLRSTFELVWATAWNREANELLAPLLGLPPLAVVEFDETAGPGESWKLSGIQRFVGNRAFAWIDDDIGHDAIAWAKARRAPTLLVETQIDRGLDEVAMEQLLGFSDRLGRKDSE
jgi:HAD domain in Swiss Army Knife RNA repair proteins